MCAAALSLLTFAAMQVFREPLAAERSTTILGGFVGSIFFIFLLTVSLLLARRRPILIDAHLLVHRRLSGTGSQFCLGGRTKSRSSRKVSSLNSVKPLCVFCLLVCSEWVVGFGDLSCGEYVVVCVCVSPAVVVCLLLSMFVSALVHRVSATTWSATHL